MADQSEHRKHGLHQHALIPFSPSAELEIGWVSFRGMKSWVRQNDHLVLEAPDQTLEAGVTDIGGSAVPGAEQAQMIKHQAQLSSHNLAIIGRALLLSHHF
jgi:hypothetical protein